MPSERAERSGMVVFKEFERTNRGFAIRLIFGQRRARRLHGRRQSRNRIFPSFDRFLFHHMLERFFVRFIPVRSGGRYPNTGRLRRPRKNVRRGFSSDKRELVRQSFDGRRFDPAIRTLDRRAASECVCPIVFNRLTNPKRCASIISRVF